MRKILIGLVSLGMALGVYMLYHRISETPQIDTDRAVEAIRSTADVNAANLNGEMGKIGDVGVGPVRKARYITLNEKTKEIEREFGFEKLLHQVRDVWDIEKPYMNVYRRNFKCFITADKGQVQVETAVGRTTPKDATFSSNVVIHVVPTETGGIKECFVYLDDIIFLSEKSLLSTAGPIRFESEDARMQGKGLELIYNEQAERLEYFKIIDLESMSYRLTSSQAALFTSTPTLVEAPAELNIPAEAQEPPSVNAGPEPVEPNKTTVAGEYYKCILNDNVLIDTPDQLIFADQRFSINDIFWSREFLDQSENSAKNGTDTTAGTSAAAPPPPAVESSGETAGAEPNAPPSFIVITCDGGLVIVPKDSTRIPDESAQAEVKSTVSEDQCPAPLDDGTERTKFFARTINYNAITGDVIAGGRSELTHYTTTEANEPPMPMKVTAREGAKYSKASNRVVLKDCLCRMPQAGLTEQRDVTFSAPEITVDLPQVKTKQPDILAAGPVELAFYMEDKGLTTKDNGQSNSRPSSPQPLTPVNVHARKRAHYSATLNQLAFEDDCRCTMIREDPNIQEQYVLLADRMTIDLAEDANERTSGPAAGVEHLTATGQVVRLATTRFRQPLPDQETEDKEHSSLGGVELKCRQFDYDAVQQLYWATGPGILKLNNTGDSGASRPAEILDARESNIENSEPNLPDQESNVENRESPNRDTLRQRFSLREPCWAIVGGFNTLSYSLLENRILADASPQEKLWVIYAPMTGDDRGEVTATASHVQAFLRETPDGQVELATLNATGGILYEDDRNHQFIGSELFYDHTAGIVKVMGDATQACFYNGTLVDQIQYDVNADKVESNVVGPSIIQLGQ